MQNLKEMIKIGTVSSVDIKNRTARVIFNNIGMVSGNLKVLTNQPLIVISTETDGEPWDIAAKYASPDRGLGKEETYRKILPDEISGTAPENQHKFSVEVFPWLPYIGQMVLCIFIPDGDGDGFVIGGM